MTHRLFPRPVLKLCLVSIALQFALATLCQGKVKWDLVEEADRQATESARFPGVSAECLFWKTAMDSSANSQWFETYARFKVYNAKTAQENGVLSIEYDSDHKIWDLAARIIKPSGQIIELADKDFTDSVLKKTKDSKQKLKTAAFPNLEAGDIVEHTWKQEVDTGYYHWIALWIERDFPTRVFKFTLRGTIYACEVLWFNVERATASQEKGLKVLTVLDVPSFKREPNMPPEGDVRGMVAIISTDSWSTAWGKESAWKDIASYEGEQRRLVCRPSEDLRRKAAELTKGLSSEDEKIAALYDFARSEITNLDFYDDANLQAIKKKLDKRDDPPNADDTFHLRAGYSDSVNKVFASLCKAAGFEVTWAYSSNKDTTTLINHPQGFVFLTKFVVGVKTAAGLRYYSPGSLFNKLGILPVNLELAPGLLLEENSKDIHFSTPPAAPAAESTLKRTGHFQLTSDGDLEGDVTIEYTGHRAAQKKGDWHSLSDKEMEKMEREELVEEMPTVELSNFRFENRAGTGEPTKMTFHLKQPGFAAAAGENLVLAPAVFSKDKANPFSSKDRKWPVVFPYAYRDTDEISIQLPADLTLDSPTAPQGFGKENEPIRARYSVKYKRKSNTLEYSRDVTVGDGNATRFPAKLYAPIRERFEQLAKSDRHTILLKTVDASTPPPSGTEEQK